VDEQIQTGQQGQGEARQEPKSDARTFTQEELNAIVARETKKITSRFEPAIAEAEKARARLAELEEAARAAEEAKLSAAQRADLERKREREGYEKRIAELDAGVTRERTLRHQSLVRHAAASKLSTVSAKLFNAEIAEEIEGIVANSLRVEEIDGREVVSIRLGAEGDTEPLETGWQKFVDAKLSKFFKAAGGAGAAHGGGGASGGVKTWGHLSPADKIAAGLPARRHTGG